MEDCLNFSGRVLMKNILLNITKSGDSQEINNLGSLLPMKTGFFYMKAFQNNSLPQMSSSCFTVSKASIQLAGRRNILKTNVLMSKSIAERVNRSSSSQHEWRLQERDKLNYCFSENYYQFSILGSSFSSSVNFLYEVFYSSTSSIHLTNSLKHSLTISVQNNLF